MFEGFVASFGKNNFPMMLVSSIFFIIQKIIRLVRLKYFQATRS